MKLHVYHDPGHAWLAAPKALLVKLGIADDISAYSYERGQWAHLEEDCDAGRLLFALKAKRLAFELVHHHTDRRSKIRGYGSYRRPADAEAARKAADDLAARADA